MPLRLTLGLLAVLGLVAIIGAILGSGDRATATGGNSITSPDTNLMVGHFTSVVLDADGNPVISYYDNTNDDLKLLHCDDPNCSGAGESITAPDTSGDVGQYTSLALDVSGNPVVSYWDRTNGDLKILHCNDPACAGSDESITSPDTFGTSTGLHTSLALDSNGHPVVSYYYATDGDLRVLHCNDPNCAGGDDVIFAPDAAFDVGRYTSLELDLDGNPVISYYDVSFHDLKVLHCGDPFCSSGNTFATPDTTGDVGAFTSLSLDENGSPVVSYQDVTNRDLKVLHCLTAVCIAGNSITSPDTAGSVGLETSLALDGDGNPVVSYHDATNFDVKLLHCGDANCSSGNSINSPDSDVATSVGRHSSLVLDGGGNPVVSYYNESKGALKLLHCSDPACSGVKPTPTPTPEAVGGIAELPDVDGTPQEASGSSGPGTGLVAGIAAVGVVGAVTLGGAAWYARRRLTQ